VLLRGAEPLAGVGDDAAALRGPGRLARAFGLTTAHTGLDLVRSALHVRAGEPVPPSRITRSARIGIAASDTSERPWRFSVRGSRGVTR
jgi:DNA-3-methyladenine glycosylase